MPTILELHFIKLNSNCTSLCKYMNFDRSELLLTSLWQWLQSMDKQ